MKTRLLLIAVGLFAATLVGCRDSTASDQAKQFPKIAVRRLDAPATVALGAPVDAGLTVEVGGCVVFDHVSEMRDGSQINLAAWGRVIPIPPNAACEASARLEPHTYRLEPPFPTRFTIVVQPIQFGILLTRDVQVQ